PGHNAQTLTSQQRFVGEVYVESEIAFGKPAQFFPQTDPEAQAERGQNSVYRHNPIAFAVFYVLGELDVVQYILLTVHACQSLAPTAPQPVRNRSQNIVIGQPENFL